MAVAAQEISGEALKSFSPVDELDAEKLAELAASAFILQFGKGQTVAAKSAKNVWIYLLSGSVERVGGGEDPELIKAKTDRSRYALSSPQNRARVVAKSDTTVLCIDGDRLDFLRDWGDGRNGAGTAIEVAEIDTDSADWVDGLMRSDAVHNLSPSSIQALMAAIEPIALEAGDTVFGQGDAPDYYYIISSGRCVVSRAEPGAGEPVELAVLAPGSAFGEEALITESPRSATVRMLEKGVVLRLSHGEFKNMLEHPLVNTVDAERAEALRANGAVTLDLSVAGIYAHNGAAVSLPFPELRNRMGELSKDQTYVIVSDDDKVSAAGAFLLSQRRFGVAVLKSATSEKVVDQQAIEADRRPTALEATAMELERQLAQVTSRLKEEEENHAAAKDRVRALEDKLRTTTAGAKAAIAATDTLKNKSEIVFREKLNQFAVELKGEQKAAAFLAGENERLNEALTVVQTKLQRAESATKEAQKREAELRDTLASLGAALEQHHAESEQLRSSYAEVEGRFEELEHEKRSLNEQIAELKGRVDQAAADNEGLARRAQEAQEALDEKIATIDSLHVQLGDATRQAEKSQAEAARARDEKIEEHAQLVQAHQENARLDMSRKELNGKVAELTGQLRSTKEAAASTARQLEQEIADLKQDLDEKVAQFGRAEANYQQKIVELEGEINSARQDIGQLTERVSAQDTQIAALTSEVHSLEKTKRRRGYVIAALTVFLLVASAGVVASFTGVDLRGEVASLIRGGGAE